MEHASISFLEKISPCPGGGRQIIRTASKKDLANADVCRVCKNSVVFFCEGEQFYATQRVANKFFNANEDEIFALTKDASTPYTWLEAFSRF